MYEEVSCWPRPTWGAPLTLPLGEMGAISAQLPELSTLLGAAVPFSAGGAGSRAGSRGGSQTCSPRATSAPVSKAAAAVHDSGGAAAATAAGNSGEEWLEELDATTGLPLCLLPQAYGQQELVEGPFAEVG